MTFSISEILRKVFSKEFKPANITDGVSVVLEELRSLNEEHKDFYLIENTYLSNEYLLLLGKDDKETIRIQILPINNIALYLKGYLTLSEPQHTMVKNMFLYWCSWSDVYNKDTYDYMLSMYHDAIIRTFILPLFDNVITIDESYTFTGGASTHGKGVTIVLYKKGVQVYEYEYTLETFLSRPFYYDDLVDILNSVFQKYVGKVIGKMD